MSDGRVRVSSIFAVARRNRAVPHRNDRMIRRIWFQSFAT